MAESDMAKKRKRMSEEIEDEVGDFTGSMVSIMDYTEALINILANPSLKINKTNQEEIRRVIYAILEQAVVQSNAINLIMGRLIEQKEILNTVLKKKETTPTYAEIIKKPERKCSLSRKREETIVALIYPKTDTESENTRDDVKRNVKPVNLGMEIKKVKKISKGGVLMELSSNSDYDKLAVEINTNDNLRVNYTIRKAAKLNPKIIIYDLPVELENDEIITSIEAQGSKIEFTMKSKRGKHVIVSLEPEPFNQIIKRGKINIK